MIGALAGDMIGSAYEQHPIKTTDFPLFQPRSRFTDDSVLTVAVADAILTGQPYQDAVRDWGRRYPWADYGGTFFQWLFAADPRPYHRWGNGAAMRVSPVGWLAANHITVLNVAGPRESQRPGGYAAAVRSLETLLPAPRATAYTFCTLPARVPP